MYRMRIEKTNWKMQNVNPQGKDCDDCVFRAIAGGTGISWKDTFAGLSDRLSQISEGNRSPLRV